jgi:multicomponent Na+:H+ antiporter subunit E
MFILMFLVWVMLVWPFETVDGRLMIQAADVLVGLLVALLVAFLVREVTPHEFERWMSPGRYVWLVAYWFVLAYYIVKANLDVAYRVLHPAMPICPGIVKVKTELKTDAAIAALSNSITLTPGTLTVNADGDGNLYVHWINVRSQDPAEASEFIVKRFEWFLKRIFE